MFCQSVCFASTSACFDYIKSGSRVDAVIMSPAYGGNAEIIPLNEQTDDYLKTLPDSGNFCVKGTLTIDQTAGARFYVYSVQ
jgi:hypothetical protein